MNGLFVDFLQSNEIDIYDDKGKKLKQALIDTKNLEHFADSLVEECVRICTQIYFENYPDAEEWEQSEEASAIQDYFGV